jgi:hypothetical protein
LSVFKVAWESWTAPQNKSMTRSVVKKVGLDPH